MTRLRIIAALLIPLILNLVSSPSHSQTRMLGANALRLDDGSGNSINIVPPPGGWIGSVNYVLPVPPYPAGASGWIAAGTAAGQIPVWNVALNSWQPSSTALSGFAGGNEPFLTFAADGGSLTNNRVVTNGSGIGINIGVGDNAAYTISNTGVLSLAGTTNQILVNGGLGPISGAITLTLPQAISSANSPTFTGLTLSGLSAGGVVKAAAGTGLLSVGTVASADILDGTIANIDVSATAAIAYSKLNLNNSIQTSDIIDGSITDAKVANGISYSKLSGAPTSLPPSGAAGGDLTGTYPNPVIAANSVTSAKIADGTITNADVSAAAAISYSKLNLTGTLQGSDVAAGTFTTTNANVALGNNDNTARELRLLEPSGSGVNFTGFKAPAQAADIHYVLPNAQGAGSTFLKNDGAGNLTWGTAGGASFTLTAKNANYTVANTDQFVQCDIGAGSFTITLPNANTFQAGQSVVIKAVNDPTNTNQVTLATTGAQTVDDGAVGVFFANPLFQGQAVRLYSDGNSKWYSW